MPTSSISAVKTDTSDHHGCVILLVDDDPAVRAASADMLEELGYRVVQACSGEEALVALQARSDLSVVVSDIRMPGMSGIELSERVRDLGREVRVILMSGYFVPEPLDRRLLRKPFRTQELNAAIQAELSRSAM